uniref:Uncharacterized protein n=1 Tax=Eutreptiella gymnastica TaxID=73025 RepID=A0A7S1JBE4_9EUGL
MQNSMSPPTQFIRHMPHQKSVITCNDTVTWLCEYSGVHHGASAPWYVCIQIIADWVSSKLREISKTIKLDQLPPYLIAFANNGPSTGIVPLLNPLSQPAQNTPCPVMSSISST